MIANFDVTNLYGPQQDWDHGLGGPIDGVAREYVPVPASAIVKIPKSTKLSWPQLAVSIEQMSLRDSDRHSATDRSFAVVGVYRHHSVELPIWQQPLETRSIHALPRHRWSVYDRSHDREGRWSDHNHHIFFR